jgi:hypothetical protein
MMALKILDESPDIATDHFLIVLLASMRTSIEAVDWYRVHHMRCGSVPAPILYK